MMVLDRKEIPLIHATIQQDGDQFFVEIPQEDMDRFDLHEGDDIVFFPVKQPGRTKLRPEVQKAFEESWERNEAGYRYLADR